MPRRFGALIVGHDVSTVRDQGWLGLRNGVLLRAASAAGFDALITADSSLRHQQNVARSGVSVIVLVNVRNRLSSLRPLIADVLVALATIRRGEVLEIRPPRDSVRDRVA